MQMPYMLQPHSCRTCACIRDTVDSGVSSPTTYTRAVYKVSVPCLDRRMPSQYA